MTKNEGIEIRMAQAFNPGIPGSFFISLALILVEALEFLWFIPF